MKRYGHTPRVRRCSMDMVEQSRGDISDIRVEEAS